MQTLPNEDSCVGHFSCAFVSVSTGTCLLCLFTDAASAAHTMNTAWPQKIERMKATREEEVQGRKRVKEETKEGGKASVVKMKGGKEGWGVGERDRRAGKIRGWGGEQEEMVTKR